MQEQVPPGNAVKSTLSRCGQGLMPNLCWIKIITAMFPLIQRYSKRTELELVATLIWRNHLYDNIFVYS